MLIERIVIIRDKTSLEQLIERFNSKGQARFYIESSGGSFQEYEEEHDTFYQALNTAEAYFTKKYKVKIIQSSFLPTYIFGETDMVVVIGQDGLVANTAKYVGNKEVLSINPDVKRYDGILLKSDLLNFRKVFESYLNGQAVIKEVTIAKARLNDGQELLAFNDFYIGAASHISSRYKVRFGNYEERQSSSGIIISTGAGSTGWLSSVFNMANNINGLLKRSVKSKCFGLEWEDKRLLFVIREPFKSKISDTSLGCGIIEGEDTLEIESLMPEKGVIFSDGIESDFIHFNTGARVSIGIADQRARLISA